MYVSKLRNYLLVPQFLGVANILIEEGGIYDSDVIKAAILHDTVEDTDTTFEEIESNFGSTIRGIVVEVTDDKSLPKMERKKQQVERIESVSKTNICMFLTGFEISFPDRTCTWI